MNTISPLASVSPKAKLGDNIEIGPFAFIDDDVEIGDGCKIHPHAMIYSYVKMGKNCQVFPGAVVGAIPQDLKYEGEVTYVEIGDNVTIRECVTINRGTKASGKCVTKIGSNTLLMSYVHVAHDCVIGDDTIFANNATLAGHVHIGDWVIFGGLAAIHQFGRVGSHAFVAGMAALNKDVPPYVMAAGHYAKPFGVNSEGLKRRGFTPEAISAIKRAYKVIYRQGLTVEEALPELEAMAADEPAVLPLVDFLKQNERGIVR